MENSGIVLLESLCCESESEGSVACFNPNLLEHVGPMQPQQKRMMVEITRAFVKLKQNKAAVSAGGTKFDHNEDIPLFVLLYNGRLQTSP